MPTLYDNKYVCIMGSGTTAVIRNKTDLPVMVSIWKGTTELPIYVAKSGTRLLAEKDMGHWAITQICFGRVLARPVTE